jgi:hypothetical protein
MKLTKLLKEIKIISHTIKVDQVKDYETAGYKAFRFKIDNFSYYGTIHSGQNEVYVTMSSFNEISTFKNYLDKNKIQYQQFSKKHFVIPLVYFSLPKEENIDESWYDDSNDDYEQELYPGDDNTWH